MIKTQNPKPASFLKILAFFLFITPLTFSACASQNEAVPDPSSPESTSDEAETEESSEESFSITSDTSTEKNGQEKVSAGSISEAPASPEASTGRPQEQSTETESSRSQSEVFDAFSTSKFENIKRYGNCSVFDGVDLVTDEVTHCLICMDPTGYSDEKNRWSFHFNRYEEILSFIKGRRYSSRSVYTGAAYADKTDVTELLWPVFAKIKNASSNLPIGILSPNRRVAIRVDQGKVRVETWKTSVDNVYFTSEKILVRELLDDMAKGKHVVIKVYKDSGGTLPLDNFADAAADYKDRVAQSKELWQ